MTTPYGKELAAMKRATLEAMAIAEAASKSRITATLKKDHSFVTKTDVACEDAIVQRLSRVFPKYGYLGEEKGERGNQNARFIVDALDGTRLFMHGLPFYGPMIALEVDGRVVASVMGVSGFRELYWAEKGHGAFLSADGGPARRLHVTRTPRVKDAIVACYKGDHQRVEPRVSVRVGNAAKLKYLFGAITGFSFAMVASGRVDAMFRPSWRGPWNVAAGELLIREAGGVTLDQNGRSPLYARTRKLWVAVGNPALVKDLFRTAFSKKT